MRILAISGSVRTSSSNAALLRAAADLAPDGMELGFFEEQIGELPVFSPDLDGEGAVPPAPIKTFRALLAAADGVLIATPEYAHGIPGVLKNALDWIVSSGELEGKPVALIVASPSGGQWAQASLTPTLEVMGARIVVNVAWTFTRKDIGADGTVADADLAMNLKGTLEALASAIKAA